MVTKPIRVLIAKVGLDGHDRGAKIIAKALADTGMEVIYTGIRQTPEQVVSTAIQEDVDIIGLSSLSGGHEALFPRVVELLKARGSNIRVIGGGIIPPEDASKLKKQGIAEIFGPGTPTKEIVRFIKGACQEPVRDEESKMLKQIDHIGIAVRDLEKSLDKYAELYGAKATHTEVMESLSISIAFIPVGEVLLELLQPLAPGKGRIGEFLEKYGEGFHHIAYRVDNLDRVLAKMKENGIKLRDDKPRPGADNTRIAFISPEETGNVLTELVESKKL
ncbi:MAG: VOC family protein [Chloroflexi bacterium]|nr:VOC family protein [Chloroflexota bacterium]